MVDVGVKRPLNVLVALDSFKGTLSSLEVNEFVARAWEKHRPQDIIRQKQMADGGEGTIEVIVADRNCTIDDVFVWDALHEKRHKVRLYWEDTRALFDLASCCGIEGVSHLDPWHADTWGLGEVIAYVVKEGATEINIGIGSSASMDCGWGMLKAIDAHLNGIPPVGAPPHYGLGCLAETDPQEVRELIARLKLPQIYFMADVDNNLSNAVRLFGPQKGLDIEDVDPCSRVLQHFGAIMGDYFLLKGAGAAGGVGTALYALGGTAISGAHSVAVMTRVDTLIETADVIITGEGRLDGSTLRGKVPQYFVERAPERVICLAGSMEGTARDYDFEEYIIMAAHSPLEVCMNDPETAIERAVDAYFRDKLGLDDEY
ncbi:MAG: glycerate kinase [Corynebacterium sp.]|nr:glycerate kinase [Corynebacterium sp.]